MGLFHANYRSDAVHGKQGRNFVNLTFDSEGLVNNHGVEPEMYDREPGDARSQLDSEETICDRELDESDNPDAVLI